MVFEEDKGEWLTHRLVAWARYYAPLMTLASASGSKFLLLLVCISAQPSTWLCLFLTAASCHKRAFYTHTPPHPPLRNATEFCTAFKIFIFLSLSLFCPSSKSLPKFWKKAGKSWLKVKQRLEKVGHFYFDLPFCVKKRKKSQKCKAYCWEPVTLFTLL